MHVGVRRRVLLSTARTRSEAKRCFGPVCESQSPGRDVKELFKVRLPHLLLSTFPSMLLQVLRSVVLSRFYFFHVISMKRIINLTVFPEMMHKHCQFPGYRDYRASFGILASTGS